MRSSFFQRQLEKIYDTFKGDTSKMIIWTGTLGWALSSAAQIGAIFSNKKITPEKKSFLLPQEFMDAVVNIGAFMGFTLLTKKGIQKLAQTGKIAPQTVRDFLNKNSVYKNKVGKLDFNLDDVLKNHSDKNLKDAYEAHKNFVTTMGTIGASVISCNLVTPVIRNSIASNMQQKYLDMKKNPHVYPEPPKDLRI